MEKISVLLARTTELWWDGLIKLLSEKGQLNIMDICYNEADTIGKVKLIKPDIVLIDEEILTNVNKDVTRYMNEIYLQTNIIVVTKPYKNIDVVSIFKMRARAYIDRDITLDELIDTLEKVANGGMIVISPLVAAQLLKCLGQSAEPGNNNNVRKEFDISLSKREIEILNHLAINGTTNKEIANDLYISENTVKSHIANIMWKMNVKNRQQAAALAIRKGMIADNTLTTTK